MRWKQFFTPVKSMDASEARSYIEEKPSAEVLILDVRQPNEYNEGHISGAKLIPLPELDARTSELNPQKPTLVYCAIGGRSRVAAQILSGKGFDNVINLSGGFRGWNGGSAIGDPGLGLDLFSGSHSIRQILQVAYSLEGGLEDFYDAMGAKSAVRSVKDLFAKLSEVEAKHQDRIFEAYRKEADCDVTREEFEKNVLAGAVEGGMTTDEYLKMFNPDMDSPKDIAAMAMSIEGQALDLYMRASENTEEEGSKTALAKLADEERMHLKQLGRLLESL